jgi:tetratricopeptide (TPR) repeat protein
MTNNLASLINKAQSLYSQHRLADALPVYKQICSIDKTNADAWMAYGGIAGNLGRLSEAETAFRRACSLRSKFGRQHEFLVQALEGQGKFDKAIQVLQKIRSSGSFPADIDLRTGVLYGKMGDFQQSINYLERYISEGNINSYAHHCLASAFESISNHSKAEANYIKAISLSNNDYQLHNNYGGFLQQRGRLDDAIAQYTRAIEINSQYPLALYNLAFAYLKKGSHWQAIDWFTAALRQKPDYIEAMNGLALCQIAVGAHTIANDILNKVIAIDDSNAEALANIGLCKSLDGEFDSALAFMEKASSIDPTNIEILCTLALAHEKRNDIESARSIILPLLETHPADSDVVSVYATLCSQFNDCDNALDLIDICLADATVIPKKKSSLHFIAGKICDRMKRYDDAFTHCQHANDLWTFDYNASETELSLKNIKALFSSDRMRTLPRSSSNDTPIFILGMPRSGTTLVEQIVSSHPDVFGAGELPYLSYLSNSLCGTQLAGKDKATDLGSINSEDLDRMAREYLRDSRKYCGNEKFFTDKMPHNFKLIGMINLLFPNARIIHCNRNPLDNCLSIYFSEFNALHPYATRLQDIASYYTDYYQALMTHWQNTSTIRIHNVIYEELVENQEAISRGILEYCGLDWDERCLDFHKSRRVAATLSYDQVRQPMYKKSRERWRNYEKHISPLLEHFTEYRT